MHLLLIEMIEESTVAKAAVCAQQSDVLAAQAVQGVGQKSLRVVGGTAVAGSQPAVGNHAGVGDIGHQRVVAGTALLGWIVAACRALLRAIARHHGGIQIERDAVDGKLAKHPAVQGVHC